MSNTKFSNLTNQELLEEKNKTQHNKIANAMFIGLCFGIFIYGAVKGGFNLLTFFPLIIMLPFIKNGKNSIDLEKELKSRNL